MPGGEGYSDSSSPDGGLLAARVGVAIGEAGCSPPSHALISDYFPPERRGTALSIYSLGIPIGGALGTLIGAWVGEWFGWRIAFALVGLPGLLLALVVRLTLREPVRGQSEVSLAARKLGSESTREVMKFMATMPSFLHLSFAASLHGFVGYGAATFLPSFLSRSHEMGLTERGSWLFGLGLIGTVGTYLGGWLADRFARGGDMRWYMWVPGLATIAGVPIGLGFYLVGDVRVTLGIGVLSAIAGPMYLGPSFAMTQTLVRPHMRAMASAILLFILNLIGMGLGPLFVGFLSDRLTPWSGTESIRYSLVSVVSIGNAWAAVHYFLAARTLRRDRIRKDDRE